MRYALVDNATLQSAMRIEGRVSAKDQSTIFGDILALEKLLLSILFYDQVIYLDNGSIQNKKEAKSKLNKLCRATLEKETYEKIVSSTNKLTDDLIPCIEGGTLSNDNCFYPYFDFLNNQLKFGWKKTRGFYELIYEPVPSSDSQISFSQKQMMHMILSELSDASFCKDINDRLPLLYDSHGQIINALYEITDQKGKSYQTKFSPSVTSFFRAMSYLTFRAIFYMIAARELNADPVLSPMRGRFHYYSLIYYNRLTDLNILRSEDAIKQSRCANKNGGIDINGPVILTYQPPFFVPWIAENMEKGGSFIEFAHELRKEKDITLMRLHINEIKELMNFNQSDTHSFSRALLDETARLMTELKKKYSAKGFGKAHGSKAIVLANYECANYYQKIEDFKYKIKPEIPDIGVKSNRFRILIRSAEDSLAFLQKLDSISLAQDM